MRGQVSGAGLEAFGYPVVAAVSAKAAVWLSARNVAPAGIARYEVQTPGRLVACSVLVLFSAPRYGACMTDAPDRLTPAAPEDIADALAFALRFDVRRSR